MSTRRKLLKGLLGCAVAPVCGEIPAEPVGMPGWLKMRQSGASLRLAQWMAEKRAAEVRSLMADGNPGPFVRVYDLTSGEMHLGLGAVAGRKEAQKEAKA